MPSKIRNDDWERLFGPHAPRRSGPLQIIGGLLLTLVLLAGVTAGTLYLLRYRDQQQVAARATATIVAATVYPQVTATIAARTAIAAANLAAQTAAAQPTRVAGIGAGVVKQGGNLRREPSTDKNNVVGLIWAGDQVLFLEQKDSGGQTWFRIQVVTPASDRAGAGVAAGTQGWASSVLVSITPP